MWRTLLVAGGGLLVARLAAGAVAVDLPRQYDRFLDRGHPVVKHLAADPRDRLSDPSNDGRLAHYRVALDQFGRTPLRGSGAGTFEITWSRHRPDVGAVRDGHSLYLDEILAYCALAAGDDKLAVARTAAAARRDPQNWTLYYGLARMRAITGRDPRAAAREARRLNPLEPMTIDTVKRFDGLSRPSEWRKAAQGMDILFPDL